MNELNFFSLQMDVKYLNSWKISSSQPFYPIKIRCIGNDDKERALTTYATDTVNTFIFRNFSEDIKNDKPAHKCYLHNSFFPEYIKDIIVGTNESAILLENGRIMYFASSKKLMTVQYLSGVKSICSTRNGFVLICISADGMECFIEFHPDTFRENDPIGRRQQFNISFENIMEHQSTWHQNYFKVKELIFDSIETNLFLKTILPDNVIENNDAFLFLSIDKNFCSVHIVNGSPLINPIVMCTTKIIDFWAYKNQIMLLNVSGIIEILYLSDVYTSMSKSSIFLGSQIHAYDFHGSMFMFSNGFNVEYGMIESKNDTFIFKRKSIGLSGIVAMTYLPEHQIILCLNENCHFYTISIQMLKKNQPIWVEMNENVHRQLLSVKYQLIEIVETHERLLDQQMQRKEIMDVIQLKRSDLTAIKNDDATYRFLAFCSVTQTPPATQRCYESSPSMAYISNSEMYGRKTSFFVIINIYQSVRYANDFDANLWRLCCRWLNDKHENVYANIKLCKGQLSFKMPITLTIHLRQNRLPCFHIDIFTSVTRTNHSSLQLNFPVHVDQPDYCDMINVSASHAELDDKHLICVIPMPKSVLPEDLFVEESELDLRKTSVSMKPNKYGTEAYSVYLLGKILTATRYPETNSCQLITKDVDLMHLFKKLIQRKIEKKLSRQGDVKVWADTLKEYCVSKTHLSK